MTESTPFAVCLATKERENYTEALKRHYEQGPRDWKQRFVSVCASAHASEDSAETWARYLHMTDALKTAVASGLALRTHRPDDPAPED